jgi:hypothetical protein
VSLFGSTIDRRLVDEYQAVGVSRCVFRLPPAPADEVLPVLDRAAELIRQLV